MSKLASIGFVPVALVLATAAASAQGTSAQRAACTPDVMSLCFGDIPNVTKITACLRREKPRLSPACRGVFDALDRPQVATRSLDASPAGQTSWCAFGADPAPGQDVWIAWCSETARAN